MLFGIGLKNRSLIFEIFLSVFLIGERKNFIIVDLYEERMKMKSGVRLCMESSLSLRIVIDEVFNLEIGGLILWVYNLLVKGNCWYVLVGVLMILLVV